MRRNGGIIGLVATLWVVPAAAAPTPPPQAQLEQTKKEIAQAQDTQNKLQEQAEAVQSEMATLQAQLVHLAATAQKSEADLTASEDRLKKLTQQVAEKDKQFKTRQNHLSSLVEAAISLSHTPPEAMIMMPGDVTKTMKAARALKMASDSVKSETLALGKQLSDLQKTREALAKEHDTLAARQAELDSQQKDLQSKLVERKTLQKRLNTQARQTEARLAALAKKSAGLQQLIEKIEDERKEREKAAAEAENARRKARTHSFADAKGHIRTPVSGKVVERFGDNTGANATAKGITIETRSGAAVTAPFDGEVVFTGPFLKYGKMVIIRHTDGFHTLLAGLEKIDVDVGQFLLEGEPIGAMGEDADATELYVELRKDNQPVDPAPWMNALSKRKN